MNNFIQDLEEAIECSFEILRNGNCQTRLVFPVYPNNYKRRVSEQELRFVFVEQIQSILQKYNYYYSVETPTEDKYKFSEDGKKVQCKVGIGQSASFDLTIRDSYQKQIVIIEFKAKMASSHEYAKDFCKLRNTKETGEYRYFLNVFERITDNTKQSFEKKISENKFLPKMEKKKEVRVYACSLDPQDTKFEIHQLLK